MKYLYVVGFLGWLLMSFLSLAFGADAPLKCDDYRTTPGPLRLLFG